jgi:AraC family transcriptional regulator
MVKIPQLWHELMQQIDQIKNRPNQHCIGLVEAMPKGEANSRSDELFYIAGAEVKDFEGAPKEMLQRTIPAGRYARFTHHGKLDRLEQTMNYIYGSWLPESKMPLRNAPHLELYDERFDIGSDQSEFDILLPVM